MGFFEQLIDGGDSSLPNQLKNPYVWRVIDGNPVVNTYETYASPATSDSFVLTDSIESKESYGHPVRFLGRTNRNIGGKFVHTKFKVDKPGPFLNLQRGNPADPKTLWRRSTGVIYPSGTMLNTCRQKANSYLTAQAATTSKLALASDLSLDASGATAISRVAPTNPLVDLSTSLAELYREGLPQVPGSAGNLGGEYLNVMFGYLPLYGDLSDLRKTVQKAEKLLSQYERDSGRWIHRLYEFPEERTSSLAINSSATCSAGGGLQETGLRETRTTTRTKTWFEGVFTYYLPRKGWRRTVAELDYLYGIKPGVDTVWQLTGFSWLADYFANVGDVMSNINSFSSDGLVMPYGYVMRESRTTVEEYWTGNLWINGVKRRHSVDAAVSWTTHQRRLANPFGFGLSDGALSARQQSILVALGLSRL